MNPPTEATPSGKSRTFAFVAIGLCAALLILFAILSASAARTKSATFDEPLQLVGGIVRRTTGDFAMNAQDPVLFAYWAALPFSPGSVRLRHDIVIPKQMNDDHQSNELYFSVVTLFQTPENNGDELVQQSRFMFIILGVALGAVIAWWSWKMAGAGAAILATIFYALDPSFLAHAAIIKNDVMFPLAVTVMAMAIYRFGIRGTWLSFLVIALSCAASLSIKYSGILCPIMIFVALTIRALLPQAWAMIGLQLTTRLQRLLVVPAACLLVGIISYAATWGCYHFRFAPSSDPAVTLDTDQIVHRIKQDRLLARTGDHPEAITPAMVDHEPPGLVANAIVWAESIHLLPKAWLWGFLYTYAGTLLRNSYLLGEVNYTGWWYYFPCTILFKTPSMTLLAMAAAVAGFVLMRFRKVTADPQAPNDWWPIFALAVPAIIYLLSAMMSTMNLGIRHILPIYPFIYIGISAGLVALIRRLGHLGVVVTAVLLLGLIAESVAAYPNYIAFFNVPSGGSIGGFRLLGDSNLDWGQDLKLLAEWQKSAPPKKMYLGYFGVADPAYYGVNAINMPGGWQLALTKAFPPANEPCYIAVSATDLQGIYFDDESRAVYQALLNFYPTAIVGGTIYIYDLPFSAQMQKPHR